MCSIRCWLWTLDLAQRHNGPIICAAHASKDYSERLIVIVSQGIRTGLSGNLRALHTLTRSDQAWPPLWQCSGQRENRGQYSSDRLSHFGLARVVVSLIIANILSPLLGNMPPKYTFELNTAKVYAKDRRDDFISRGKRSIQTSNKKHFETQHILLIRLNVSYWNVETFFEYLIFVKNKTKTFRKILFFVFFFAGLSEPSLMECPHSPHSGLFGRILIPDPWERERERAECNQASDWGNTRVNPKQMFSLYRRSLFRDCLLLDFRFSYDTVITQF